VSDKVLVIEDDRDLRESLCEALELEGYHVAAVENGAEALDYLQKSEPPCLILLDLMMPVMDGWTFVEQCRRLHFCGDVPIVVTSASHDLPRTAEQLRAMGVRTCLAKPFDVEGLLALVERYAPAA
jgi:CheY-like chemotaxis protein